MVLGLLGALYVFTLLYKCLWGFGTDRALFGRIIFGPLRLVLACWACLCCTLPGINLLGW